MKVNVKIDTDLLTELQKDTEKLSSLINEYSNKYEFIEIKIDAEIDKDKYASALLSTMQYKVVV